jgi:mono/diheme cytochrome c family protein/plastocyanin
LKIFDMTTSRLPQKNHLPESIARMLVILSLLGVVLIVGISPWRDTSNSVERVLEIHARVPEDGGWSPGDLSAQVGETLRMRLTSDDVMHGFAIGGEGLNGSPISVDVEPGKLTEVSLNFDQAGKYTYYCTRWCGVNHWRMRGTIEVGDPEDQVKQLSNPLYLALGLDLDAPHPAGYVPQAKPSAARGAMWGDALAEKYLDQGYFRSHSPAQIWKDLRSEPSMRGFSDQEIWDLVAFVWWTNTSSQMINEGEQLYAANCAACHGESGAGDGVMADQLADNTGMNIGTDHELGHTTVRPSDFTSAKDMLGASPAHLQGKILRGGMGTGMPYWGPIFSDEQTWALVDYLLTFQFDKEENP